MRQSIILVLAAIRLLTGAPRELDQARDRQDRSALERMASSYSAAAAKQANDAQAQYMLAVAQSYLAEVATELKDKNGARSAAETGIKAAEKAMSLKPTVAEHHRILGTLCGQADPGQCAGGAEIWTVCSRFDQ